MTSNGSAGVNYYYVSSLCINIENIHTTKRKEPQLILHIYYIHYACIEWNKILIEKQKKKKTYTEIQ